MSSPTSWTIKSSMKKSFQIITIRSYTTKSDFSLWITQPYIVSYIVLQFFTCFFTSLFKREMWKMPNRAAVNLERWRRTDCDDSNTATSICQMHSLMFSIIIGRILSSTLWFSLSILVILLHVWQSLNIFKLVKYTFYPHISYDPQLIIHLSMQSVGPANYNKSTTKQAFNYQCFIYCSLLLSGSSLIA